MGNYKQLREENRKKSVAAGIVSAAVFHAVVLALLLFTGLRYIYPPPPETGIEISFEEEPEPPQPIRATAGTAPKAPVADPDKDIRLAKASASPYEGSRPNEAEEAVNDDFGDIETEDPRTEEEKKEIDKRALFPSADNKAKKDTLAAQTAAIVSKGLRAGHPSGNTSDGENEDTPNVMLAGRWTEGSLPEPEYGVQIDGKIVVKIQVDQHGTVKNAYPGEVGTTITSKELWEAVKEAALKTKFNVSSEAPLLQEGTITYYFRLK